MKRILSFILALTMIMTMAVVGIGAINLDSGYQADLYQMTTVAAPYDKMPHTFEAIVHLPTDYANRAGVIVGNYGAAMDCISFEIQAGGLPRLYYQDPNGTVYNYVFAETDMRSDEPIRLTMVHDPDAATITCYINGEAKQTMDAAGLPEIVASQPMAIGGDFRGDNAQYFKGTLYEVRLYSDPLSADEVKAGNVDYAASNLIAAYDFTTAEPAKDLSGHGYDINGKFNIVAPSYVGFVPTAKNHVQMEAPLEAMPLVFDAVVKLSTANTGRAGSIAGTYVTTSEPFFNFDVWENGQPRLLFYDANLVQHVFYFDQLDLRSDDKPVRVTLVQNLEDNTLTCYINGGEKSQTHALPDGYTNIVPAQPMAVGSDNRAGNDQFFKGCLYSLDIYSETMTADQVAAGEGNGLIASYNFTASADQTTDLSGNGHNLIGELNLENPDAYVEPEITDGLTFDAAMMYQTNEDGYADAPYTYSAWVYLSKTHADRGGVIIGNYQSGGIPCVSIEIAAGGVPRFYHINLSGAVTDLKFAEADLRTGDWAHVAFTVTDVVTCYVNGEAVGEQPIPEFETLATEMTIGIGGDLRGGNAQYFKGRIKEIALFEDALSPTDIRTLYSKGVSAVGEDLVAHYDMTNAEPAKDIADLSGNNYTAFADPRFYTDKEPVTDYAYSFAFIGDTQNLNEKFPTDFAKIYDWLVANKADKKIEHVFGLGDITNSDTDAEWANALSGISKLDGVIPYSLVRGNHDSTEKFTATFSTDAYKGQFEGFYNDELANSWRTFKAGTTDYLFITLDYGANDDVLNWASDIISSHPDHKVIITTHCYLYRDGSTLDEGDVCPPSTSGGTNNGDHMWDKLISKHANIVMVVSGHDPNDTIVKKQVKGENGNTVTQVLIDAQTVELAGPLGMVAMFYFSEDGSHVDVEYFSTVREKFFMPENQFTLNLPDMVAKPAETEPAETEAPAETTAPVETDATSEAPAETTAPAETEAPAVAAPAKNSSAGIIIGVIAAIVVIGGAAGVVIAKKKKG